MADDNTNAQQPPKPDPDLKSLNKLVGSWEVSGGAHGRVTFEWMEGGFSLIQSVDLEQYGQKIKGLEIIGHERSFGAEPSEDINSRFYSNTGDTLTIWGGERGSPAYYWGTFSKDGNTLSGAWHYPGGGGYESTSTRVR